MHSHVMLYLSLAKHFYVFYFFISIKQALGGNIMTASPISDLNPLLLASGAVLDVIDTGNN